MAGSWVHEVMHSSAAMRFIGAQGREGLRPGGRPVPGSGHAVAPGQRCAQVSIVYGIRRRLGYEKPHCAQLPSPTFLHQHASVGRQAYRALVTCVITYLVCYPSSARSSATTSIRTMTMIRVNIGERPRTGMNETKTEPRPGPGPAAQAWRPSRWTE